MTCIPENEGDEKCSRCKYYDLGMGCVPSYMHDYVPCGRKTKGGIDMDQRAIGIVRDYALEHLDKSDTVTDFSVYIVWKCKVLKNWKFLLSTTLLDGMYYELTFNGEANEWYLDAYKKFENRIIPK